MTIGILMIAAWVKAVVLDFTALFCPIAHKGGTILGELRRFDVMSHDSINNAKEKQLFNVSSRHASRVKKVAFVHLTDYV